MWRYENNSNGLKSEEVAPTTAFTVREARSGQMNQENLCSGIASGKA